MTDPIHILHVDDEPDFAEMAAEFIEREDDRLSVETASSASEGMDRLASDEYDCIVSDYDMPAQNGIEFLETVREEYPDLPFILYTGKGSEEVASEAISKGVTDYLQKEHGTDQYAILANRITNAVAQTRAEREVTRTRAYFGTILEHASDYVIVVNEEAQVDYISPAVERVLGIPPDELEGADAFDRIHPEDMSVATEAFTEVLEHPDQEHSVEYRVRHADGSWRWLEVRGRNRLDDPVIEGIVVSAREITDRKAREEELQQKERRYQAVFNDPNILVGLLDIDGTVLDINETAMEYIDAELPDVVREPFWETPWFTGDELIQEAVRRLVEQAANGEYVEFEIDLSETVTDQLVIRGVFRPVTNDDGDVVSLLISDRDVTEWKGREKAIEELHSTARAFMEAETAEDIADITVDAVRDILDMPANGLHLYDESEGGLVPAAWTERTEEIVGEPPTFAPGEGLAGTAFETGEPQIYDDIAAVPERFNPDTSVRSQIIYPLDEHGVLVIGSPDPDAFDDTDISLAGTLAAHATTALNRVGREQELVRRQELFRAIMETRIDGILVMDENREYVTWNQQFIDMWDVPEELIGDKPEDEGLNYALGQLEDPDEFIEKVEYLYEHPQEESRDEIRLTDGRVFDRYSAPVESEDGTHFGRIWFFRDITDQKQRETELQQTTARLEALYENSPDMIHVVDSDGRLLDVNRRFCEELGYPEEHLLGRPISEVILDVTEAGVHSYLADFEMNERRRMEGVYERKDGSTVPVEVHILRMNIAGADRYMAISRDITERKAYETSLERQNERLDEFAGLVSHDLRNPLNVAQGRLELLREDGTSEDLDAVERSLDRMSALIDDLLNLARNGEQVSEMEPVDLADLAELCWPNVETGDASLVVTDAPSIEGDRSRIQQLLENLIRNAVEHGGDRVTITMGEIENGFYVEDDGVGIPGEARDEIFEDGYSTSDEGTGFGLSIVEQIAEAHGWQIHVTEGSEGGARIEITGIEFTPE